MTVNRYCFQEKALISNIKLAAFILKKANILSQDYVCCSFKNRYNMETSSIVTLCVCETLVLLCWTCYVCELIWNKTTFRPVGNEMKWWVRVRFIGNSLFGWVFTIFTVIPEPLAMSHSVDTHTHPQEDTGLFTLTDAMLQAFELHHLNYSAVVLSSTRQTVSRPDAEINRTVYTAWDFKNHFMLILLI